MILRARREDAHPLCQRKEHGPTCALCEVLEHAQERAWAKEQCGVISGLPNLLICDRESGHRGDHRGYNEQIDAPMFWRGKARHDTD